MGADSGRTVSQAGEQRSARIESLRAIAALAVLAGHVIVVAAPTEVNDNLLYKLLFGGGLGVFFFFGLTGYLIFWPFAQRYFGEGDTVDLGRYAVNRLVRILPLYYAVVFFSLVILPNIPNPKAQNFGRIAGDEIWYWTYLSNFCNVSQYCRWSLFNDRGN